MRFALRLATCVACVATCVAMSCARTPPLERTHTSARALAEAVVEAMAARDVRTLEGLAVSEQEFRDHVWPDLPAARPERNLPFSYVWGDLAQKSAASLAGLVAEHGDSRMTLGGVRFEGVTEYATYRVHRKPTFDVLGADGQRVSVRLSGSFVEKAGRWKVLSYVVD